MTKLTKKTKALQGKVDSTKLYPLADALALVKEAATAKFDESIDVAVQLGIDAKKSDQVVRGAVVMPAGTGKTKRVAVFAQGPVGLCATMGANLMGAGQIIAVESRPERQELAKRFGADVIVDAIFGPDQVSAGGPLRDAITWSIDVPARKSGP